MGKLLTEAIGTFFLVFTIGLVSISETPFAALAIGSSLMVMVYMGGHISGAHYNPAVSLAVMLRGKLPAGELVPYWLAQLAGAILAAVAVRAITGSTFAPASNGGALPALLIEILFTFALALVVLNTATSDATRGNSFYGLAIGFTVMVGAYAGGPISGGAFNPAVGAGPILFNLIAGGGGAGDLWLYLVGPFAGGALAAAVFMVQNVVVTRRGDVVPEPAEAAAPRGD